MKTIIIINFTLNYLITIHFKKYRINKYYLMGNCCDKFHEKEYDIKYELTLKKFNINSDTNLKSEDKLLSNDNEVNELKD